MTKHELMGEIVRLAAQAEDAGETTIAKLLRAISNSEKLNGERSLHALIRPFVSQLNLLRKAKADQLPPGSRPTIRWASTWEEVARVQIDQKIFALSVRGQVRGLIKPDDQNEPDSIQSEEADD